MNTIAYLDAYAPNPPTHLPVYTDGSYSAHTNTAAWAWYVHDTHWGAAPLADGTNNIAELSGILYAATMIDPRIPLLIISDSTYAVSAICSWHDRWASAGWRTSVGEEVKNADLIVAARAAVDAREHRTLFKVIRGHGKDPLVLEGDVAGNDLADRIASHSRRHFLETGSLEPLDAFSWQVVHGRGRKKRPFVERVPDVPVVGEGV